MTSKSIFRNDRWVWILGKSALAKFRFVTSEAMHFSLRPLANQKQQSLDGLDSKLNTQAKCAVRRNKYEGLGNSRITRCVTRNDLDFIFAVYCNKVNYIFFVNTATATSKSSFTYSVRCLGDGCQHIWYIPSYHFDLWWYRGGVSF